MCPLSCRLAPGPGRGPSTASSATPTDDPAGYAARRGSEREAADLSLDPPGLVRPHRDLDAVAGAELVHQRADMGLHRAQGDVQLVGDLGVGAATGDGE